jgi:hypothetical protein
MRTFEMLLIGMIFAGFAALFACEDQRPVFSTAAIDCTAYGQDTTKCDYTICALQSGGAPADTCFSDYQNCYMTACPSGTNIAYGDVNALSTCTNNYGTCIVGTPTDSDTSQTVNNLQACETWRSTLICGTTDFTTVFDCSQVAMLTCDISGYFTCLSQNFVCDEINGIPNTAGWANCTVPVCAK